MSNKIVQLENEAGDNIYPLAGGALTGSISKTMLEEGVFEGPELSEPSSVAYVATDNIQDGAVTSDKIDYTTLAFPWESYTSITKGSGVSTIAENHCMINRTLKLFCVHLDLAFSNGAPSTLVSGLPEPAGSSKFLGCFANSGTKANQWLNCWVRASGGTIGCETTTSSEAGGCHIQGIYPIQ